MAATKKKAQKPTLRVSAVKLSPDDEARLAGLAQDGSDYIGRSISGSAIVRALVRYASQQQPQWLREQIFSLVEQELEAGVLWGKQPTKGGERKKK